MGRDLKGELRVGVEKLLDAIKKMDDAFYIVFEAPTGYGKTTSSPKIYHEVVEYKGIASRLIHVLPYRSIVDQLYMFLHDKIKDKTVGYQALSIPAPISQIGIFLKSPFFFSDIVVTTIDSFTYNLMKIPVGEYGKRSGHYEVLRGSILSVSYTHLTLPTN